MIETLSQDKTFIDTTCIFIHLGLYLPQLRFVNCCFTVLMYEWMNEWMNDYASHSALRSLSEQRELPCTSAPDVLFLMLKQSEKNYLIIP